MASPKNTEKRLSMESVGNCNFKTLVEGTQVSKEHGMRYTSVGHLALCNH